jgi:small nuclear ribonucleoprotein (snRNP)-like protein
MGEPRNRRRSIFRCPKREKGRERTSRFFLGFGASSIKCVRALLAGVDPSMNTHLKKVKMTVRGREPQALDSLAMVVVRARGAGAQDTERVVERHGSSTERKRAKTVSDEAQQ